MDNNDSYSVETLIFLYGNGSFYENENNWVLLNTQSYHIHFIIYTKNQN